VDAPTTGDPLRMAVWSGSFLMERAQISRSV
jgi:hypothetical protein